MKKFNEIRIWKKFGISFIFIFLLSNLRIFMETTDSQTIKGKIIYSTKNNPRPYSTTDSVFIAGTIANTEIKTSQFKTNQFISNMDIPFSFLMLRKDFIILY